MLVCKRTVLLGLMLVIAPMTAMADTSQSTVKTVNIDGFRSAHFGMDQAKTLKAIKTDFNLSGSAVHTQVNPVQDTKALSITVPALVPNSGPAVIDYVFGYKSKTLSEVNITWAASDPANSSAVLLHTGAALQSYFQGASVSYKDVAGNKLLANGSLLLFRGADAAGHVVVLVLSGNVQRDDKDKKTQITPTELTLAYGADPAHPDVFHFAPGAF